MKRSTPELARWAPWAAVAIWSVLSLAWVRADALLRDGDEEGHVGAAELFRADLVNGDAMGFFERLWMGPMGEYPQAFAAMVGAWWWAVGEGDPSQAVVRAVCLVSLPIAALATGRIAARMVPSSDAPWVHCWATVLTLTVPLANGLTRHFMPEGALIAMTSLAVLCALRWVDHPSAGRSVLLGLALGIGLMTKQTFVLSAGLPVLWIVAARIRDQPLKMVGVLATVLAVAGPWWLMNGGQQWAYAGVSVVGHGSGGVASHAVFYPRTLFLLALGPVLTVAVAVAGWRGRGSKAWMLGMVWLVGGLLVLLFIPKKYPRLMAPLLPAAVVLLVAGWKPRLGVLRGIGVAAIGWLVWVSVAALPIHSRAPNVDPGCPQQWVRPPGPSDLGLLAVAKEFDGRGPGDILVVGDVAIPCALQTTHDWSNHLAPLLRRRGQERVVHTDPERTHRFVVEWLDDPNAQTMGPLQKTFIIRDRLSP